MQSKTVTNYDLSALTYNWIIVQHCQLNLFRHHKNRLYSRTVNWLFNCSDVSNKVATECIQNIVENTDIILIDSTCNMLNCIGMNTYVHTADS